MLRVPERVYKRRLARMVKLIQMDAPRIIIYNEARLIFKAWHPAWPWRLSNWFAGTRIGMWYMLLTDPEWWKYQWTGKSEIYGDIPDCPDVPPSCEFDLCESPEALARYIRDTAKKPVESYDKETDPLKHEGWRN